MGKQHFSFEAEVIPGDKCFLKDFLGNWEIGYCKATNTSVEVDTDHVDGVVGARTKLNIFYIGKFSEEIDKDEFYWFNFKKGDIANYDDFLEWQSRLIEAARDKFKFKGDMDAMFGRMNYSNWIPFYLENYTVNNAYMVGMGIIQESALNEDYE